MRLNRNISYKERKKCYRKRKLHYKPDEDYQAKFIEMFTHLLRSNDYIMDVHVCNFADLKVTKIQQVISALLKVQDPSD